MQFNFGKNWKNYSKKKLNDQKIIEAKDSILNFAFIGLVLLLVFTT
jgi:hypothetical protein